MAEDGTVLDYEDESGKVVGYELLKRQPIWAPLNAVVALYWR